MKAHPLASLMSAMSQDAADAPEQKVPSIAAQKETLQEFLGKPTAFKVGTFVKLNRFGKMRYRYPTDKQVGMVTDVFETPMLDEDRNVVHGEVTVVMSNLVRPYPMDFRNIEIAKK